jgi:hypothetical protein
MSFMEYMSKSAQPISMPFTLLIIIYLAASMYMSYIGRGFIQFWKYTLHNLVYNYVGLAVNNW